jgi:hypothetical protein
MAPSGDTLSARFDPRASPSGSGEPNGSGHRVPAGPGMDPVPRQNDVGTPFVGSHSLQGIAGRAGLIFRSRFERPRPRPYRAAVWAEQDQSGCHADVARLVAAVLADPWAGSTNSPVRGRRTCTGSLGEYSEALNREVTYSDIPPEDWERELKRVGLPDHLTRHLVAIAELNRVGRYE